jgi:hypothetical protein
MSELAVLFTYDGYVDTMSKLKAGLHIGGVQLTLDEDGNEALCLVIYGKDGSISRSPPIKKPIIPMEELVDERTN